MSSPAGDPTTLSSHVAAVKARELVSALVIGDRVVDEGARVRLIRPGSVVMLLGVVSLALGS